MQKRLECDIGVKVIADVPKENIMLELHSSSESKPMEFYLKYIFENTNSYEIFAHKDYQIRVEHFIQTYFK